MRLKRLVVAACVLLAAVLAAIAVAVYLLDPRSLAMSLAASVKADTGRELDFGEVRVRLLPRPALVLSEVRFGNAEWGSQPWLAQVGRLRAGLDVLALLDGRVRIEYIAVGDASVLLETDPEGRGNWVMGTAGARAPDWLKALEIDEFTLQALALAYRNGASGKTSSVQIDAARIAVPPAPRPISFSVRATFDGTSVEATGTTGALAALIENQPAYPVDLEGKIGAARVSVRGTLDDPHGLGGFGLVLRAQAPELARLAALFGAALPPLGPFRGSARLTGTAAAPVFSGIDFQAGTPERMGLTARGGIQGRLSAGGYEWQSDGLDVVVQGAQFGDLARWIGKPLPALGRYRIAARAAGTAAAPGLSAIELAIGGGETPEITLRGAVANLRAATGMDLKVEAAATHWWHVDAAAGGMRLPPFRASARLRDAPQGYRLDDLEGQIAGGTVSASLQVAQAGQRLRITGKAAASLIDLARMAPEVGSAPAPAAAPGSPPAIEYWKFADLDLDLQIGRLVLHDGRQLRSGSGQVALQDGRLKVGALQATLGGAAVKLDGSIADPQKLSGLDLRIALQGGELAELFAFFGTLIGPVGPYSGRAQLHGSLDALGVTAIDARAGRSGQSLRVSGQIDDALNLRGVDLALAADVSDSTAAGRLFGADLPPLPMLRATARFTGPSGGYAFDDIRFTLGRSSARGRVVLVPGAPRPRVTANLSGPLVDLSELPPLRSKPGGTSPLLAADIEADIGFDQVVLPDRRTLDRVSGAARLVAGAVELKAFTVALDGASATLEGRINDPLTPAAFELLVNARLTHGAGLAAFTGLRLQGLPAFTASGKLSDVPNGYALAGLKLAYAATTIDGDVAITRGAKRFKVSAKASSPLLDVSAFIDPAAAGSATKPAAAGTRVIPDVPLPLGVLRAVDADLDLRIDRIKYGDAAPLGPLLVRAAMIDGRIAAGPVQLALKDGQTLSVSGTVDAAQAGWALRIEGTAIDFGEILTRFGRPGLVTGGSTELALEVSGRGETLVEILGSLNGAVRVKVGPHRIHNFDANISSGIFLGTLNLANPFRKTDPDTDVKCLAAAVPISNGVVVSERRIAVETAKYNAVLSGTVDLRTEAIDVAVAPVVTYGFSIGTGQITEIVRLRGTLAAPALEVDPVSVFKSAVSLGAGVATLGSSWMAETLLNKVSSDPNPCATALAQ